jgi:hypothetical protein
MSKQKPDENRRGPLSKEEKIFIAQNRTMEPADIAKCIKRTPDVVIKCLANVDEMLLMDDYSEILAKLHVSPFWGEIKRGLMNDEVRYFERSWCSYVDQFAASTDILATDELMIKDLVMLDIFSQRAISEKTRILQRIQDIEKTIDKQERLPDDEKDHSELSGLRSQVSALYAAKTALSKEHLEYQNKKDTKLRDLKGSRDQRFKQLEESRSNIFDLIKELDTHKKRLSEGRLAEKVRLAAQNVKANWNELHTYDDGEVDKPFLSPEGEVGEIEYATPLDEDYANENNNDNDNGKDYENISVNNVVDYDNTQYDDEDDNNSYQ